MILLVTKENVLLNPKQNDLKYALINFLRILVDDLY